MTMSSVVWGSPRWWTTALAILGVASLAVAWSYSRTRAPGRVRLACALLKGLGIAVLVLSLVEPLLTGSRPKRGANAFVVLADNSQSLLVRDNPSGPTRGDQLRASLAKGTPWLTRIGQDFDLRRYAFDSHLRAVDDFETLSFNGTGSSLGMSLQTLSRRFRGLPLAGIVLVTDGVRTDAGEIDTTNLPPIYPIVPPGRGGARDVGIANVSVSQTNFESAPVVIRTDVQATGYRGEPIVATITDEAGKDVERQEATAKDERNPLSFRFQFRPEKRGVSVYRVRTFAKRDEATIGEATSPTDQASSEQTLANNTRLIVVDQGGGPYRVLYVSGRPNWEFKFLRRSVAEDEQVQLVGLVRIARRQPKFDFRDPSDRSASQLFKNFDNVDRETADRADQPVLIRLGTVDEIELRDGFPKSADELYRYHAVVLDDIEAGFFTPDQLTLLRNFVSVRGGGLLMLGGPDAFAEGHYDRTPVGELLPVYINRSLPPPVGETAYRFLLTREGWLQPWVRTRRTEDDERKRLAAMPPFTTLSRVGAIKPGAGTHSPRWSTRPGIRFRASSFRNSGRGRWAPCSWATSGGSGDPQEHAEETDLDRSWRQTVRWLVGDVPGRVDINLRARDDSGAPAVEITARVRDSEYRPLDNATVAIRIRRPEGDELTLAAEPDAREAGCYTTTYVTRQPGAYRFTAAATAPDGSSVGEREAGWAAQPSADEFARLEPDRDFLASLAQKSRGELVDINRLETFAASLESRGAPVTEPWTAPLWHQPWYFLLAIACLAGEWGLRRLNGLA
ncbi:MAG: hypothetical protein U0794_21325 [Isosphaeraceae bacterium]